MKPSEICKECEAWCCKYQFAVPSTAKDIEYWEQRAEEAIQLPNGKIAYVIYQPCPHLTEDNLCDIYEERPAVCREFPRLAVAVWAAKCPLLQEMLKEAPTGYKLLSRRD